MELAKLINEIFKTLVTAGLAIAVFFLVQHPGSILNREATEEEIRREQAKLLIDSFSIEDAERRNAALSILQRVYGDGDSVISIVQNLSTIQAETEIIASESLPENKQSPQCGVLQGRLQQLQASLQEESERVAAAIETDVRSNIETAIRQLETQLIIVQDAISQVCS
ncbi:hypothetical protein [Loktanella atrilutea]|uniref:hypothetical protein n=1 Tax=Loktanella atrilutea TaxID=366533 RepID=UPI000934ACD6|nr:hypothetical protein [Loktanella atrilutea]